MAHLPGSEPQADPFRTDIQRSVTPDQPTFHEPLLPPAATYLAPSDGVSTPRESYALSNAGSNSAPLLPEVGEKYFAGEGPKSKPFHKKPLVWVLAAAAIALIATAVVVPVYFTVIKPKNNTASSPNNNNGTDSNGNGNGTPTHHPPTNSISGGNGSNITTEDGSQFIYSNPYGGICESNSTFLRLHSF